MRLVLAFALAALSAFPAAAQTAPAAVPPLPKPGAPSAGEPGSLASIPAALLGDAITVSIVATVAQAEGTPPWEAKQVKYTIPGTSVTVKMVGSEVAVMITVTPHRTQSGELLLVAQGQVWYKDGEAGLRYRTTLDTISVAYGERLFFYPLGAGAGGQAPLRIEMVLDRYKPDVAPSDPAGQDGQEKAGP